MLLVKYWVSTEGCQVKWSCGWLSVLLPEAKVCSQNKIQVWKRRNGRWGESVCFVSGCWARPHCLDSLPVVCVKRLSSKRCVTLAGQLLILPLAAFPGHGCHQLRMVRELHPSPQCCCSTNNKALVLFQQNSCSSESPQRFNFLGNSG